MTEKNDLDFYVSQIQDDFMPYWSRFYDYEKGGILNCINNYGDKKLSDHKFTWSQGRYLWLLGRLYDLKKEGLFPRLDAGGLMVQMQGTYRFLTEHSIYGDSVCCYLLDRGGNKLKDGRTGRYDASLFADCFALIGMAQYTKALKLTENLPAVERLFQSIRTRAESGDYLTEPYPIPKGYRVHSIPMILVNTTYEYIKMRERLGLPCGEETAYGLGKAEEILDRDYCNGYIREHISTDENYQSLLLDRHVNPGHTLEDMWFCAEFLKDYGDLGRYLPRIATAARNAFDIGWDKEFGGLLRFVDRDGGPPKGRRGDSAFERLIVDTWDMKLWWPHSEALYVFPYLYRLTGEPDLLERYQKAKEYVFGTFPNRELGEWIQIRKRDGTPEEKVVALPVKDPFHILRDFIKIVELCK